MTSIRVLSYNIHKGFNPSNSRFLLGDIRNAIRTVGAELVLLQEVIGENKKHGELFANWHPKAQFEFLADEIWPHFAYGKNAIYQHGHHGNAVLSKYPFSFWENINATRWRFSQRGILHGRILGQIHVFCLHFGLFGVERRYQLDKLVATIHRCVPDHAALIIAGDFNDWPGRLNRELEKVLGVREAFLALQGKSARTFPARLPLLRMDRIYFRGLKLQTGQVFSGHPWRRLSDHCALYAEFELPKALKARAFFVA